MRLTYRGYDIKIRPEYPGVIARVTQPGYGHLDYYDFGTVRRASARWTYRAAIRKIDKMVDSERRRELKRRAIQQVNAENQREIERLARELGVATHG
jgi:hypothetical protein